MGLILDISPRTLEKVLYFADQQPEQERPGYIPPFYGADYEDLKFFDRAHGCPCAAVTPGSFTGTDGELQCVPLDDDAHNTPMFPHNWKKEAGSDPFVLEITCRRLVLEFKDSGAPDFGKVTVAIDGEKHFLLDPTAAGWTHCHTVVLFNRQESALHRLEFAMAPEDAEKTFTILGFGYVE